MDPGGIPARGLQAPLAPLRPSDLKPPLVNAPNPFPPRLAGLYERKRAAFEAFKKSLLHQALDGKL